MESRHYWCRRIIIYSTQNLPTATHIYSQIQFFFCFENSGSSCCLIQLSFLYRFHFEAILSKYASPIFFTAAVKVEVFSTRLTASPEFVNCGGEKFCTRHFLLWQGDVKWPLRSASALTWYHTSYGSPQILPFFLCPFFTQSSWPCHSSLLSNQARHKDLDSWWWWGWWWHWSWWYFIGPCPVKYHPADIAYCIIAGQCYIDPSQGSKGSFSVQCGSARAYLIRLGKSHHVPAVHLIIFPYTATNLKNPHQNFLRNESINRSNFFSLRDTAVSSENVRIT